MVELFDPGRFPSEGQCLLVDYKGCTSSTNVRDHYYGHAALTPTPCSSTSIRPSAGCIRNRSMSPET